jgi:uncharacterized protein YjiK
LFIWVASCGQVEKKVSDEGAAGAIPYDLTQPVEKYLMPGELNEISGISWYGSGLLACVEDEIGVIYLYDTQQKRVVRRVHFAGSGDYEDVAVVKKNAYVVRSDGTLFLRSLADPQSDEQTDQTLRFRTPLTAANDVEGLGYDAKRNRLLIACKEKQALSGQAVEAKALYGYDPDLRRMEERPLYQISWPAAAEGVSGKKSGKKKDAEKKDNWKPSGVAVHPVSHQIYLMASVGNRLLVLHPDGSLAGTVRLEPRLFRQPEGICFAPDGTLYIASEGRDGSGYILRFEPQ